MQFWRAFLSLESWDLPAHRSVKAQEQACSPDSFTAHSKRMPFQEKTALKGTKQTPHHEHQHRPGSALCTDFGCAGLPRLRAAASSRALTCPLPFEGVPHVAVEVVVAGEQQAAALGEGDGGDAADDVVVGIHHQLLVCPQVKQPACGVVRARGKRVPVGEKLQGCRRNTSGTPQKYSGRVLV